ncbi:MAG: hypothetical protein SPI58_03755 [Candidatus Enteromonas sp.]|nr:hypothetical protein [Candidatus Enteromonas sp.]
MKTSWLSKFLIFVSALTLSGCSMINMFPDRADQISDGVGSVPPSELDKEESVLPISLRQIGLTTQSDYLPSKGEVNLLVLPIEFTDAPFSAQTLKDINVALNGKSSETGYWESVSSFYEKSSFGQLHLTYTIADVYETGKTQQQVYNDSIAVLPSDNAASVIGDAYMAYIAKNGQISTRQYDSDHNGWIDGVVAIYSGKHTQKGNPSAAYDTQGYYWAYTYWTRGVIDPSTGDCPVWTNPNVNCPTPNLYVWLSYDFFYDAVKSPRVDAHTLIHETGHMFGLDDYYSQDGTAYAGCADMMDCNVVDHDVFSKMILGWITPHVVRKEEEVTFLPSQSNGDCLLIPGEEWNGTLYDEYILVELYTPTGLNQLDSEILYTNGIRGYTMPGIKVYHIDARLVEQTYSVRTGKSTYQYVRNPKTDIKSNSSSEAYGYYIAASNCYKRSWSAKGYSDKYSLLHMIQAPGVNTFAKGTPGTNVDLFTRGSFDIQSYKAFFVNRDSVTRKAVLNSGNDVPWKMSIRSVSEKSATVAFSNL